MVLSLIPVSSGSLNAASYGRDVSLAFLVETNFGTVVCAAHREICHARKKSDIEGNQTWYRLNHILSTVRTASKMEEAMTV